MRVLPVLTLIRGFAASLIGLLIVCSQWLIADDKVSANEWLEKMSRSHRELSYQGLFTYEQSGAMQTMRISHALMEGEEFERLERLDGPEHSVVRRGHGPEGSHAGEKLVRLVSNKSLDHNGMSHFYDISVVGEGRVAGRTVVEVAIMPRDRHRFGHRFSLDKKTGLLLRSVQYNAANKILERFQFIDIDYDAIMSAGYFVEKKNDRTIQPMAPVTKQPKPFEWRLKWLPAGFKSSPYVIPPSTVESMTFTDGLAVFSIFVEKHRATNPAAVVQGRAQRGATMAYSRSFLLNGGRYRVTVVGEIPSLTAERIAASIVSAG